MEYLEERAMQDKKEYQQHKLQFERSLAEMEVERNEAFKNEKLSEERLKLAQEEHAKALAKTKTKYSSSAAELEDQLQEMSA